MLDSKRKSKSAGTGNDTGMPRPSGVGALLRDERRNRSMDIQQIARITRLRENFLTAIEREAWDELPPPVFVQGFIRAYARALGLDEHRVLELYDSSKPSPVEPKPLVEPEKNWRGHRILLILLLGILGGALLYLWQGGALPKRTPAPAGRLEKAPPSGPAAAKPAEVRRRIDQENAAGEATDAPTETPRSVEPESGTGTSGAEVRRPLPKGIDPYPDPPADSASAGAAHLLVADVMERTWVQISVDGGPPKDFIFQPGSHLQWKAERGMDLLIGNAAGIVLTFDGTIIDDLGKPGQVVRVTLPEGEELNVRGGQ